MQKKKKTFERRECFGNYHEINYFSSDHLHMTTTSEEVNFFLNFKLTNAKNDVMIVVMTTDSDIAWLTVKANLKHNLPLHYQSLNSDGYSPIKADLRQ